MYFKKLTGKKCYLSPLDPADAERFAAWLNDSELTIDYGFYGSVITTETERKFLENAEGKHNYCIVDLETDRPLGYCGFKWLDRENQGGEVSIFIGDKEYRGQGYGQEALSLLIDYGFNALGLHNICLHVSNDNTAAIKCYEKIGFRIVGVLREALLLKRKRRDIALMDLLPEDFY
jgi:RimJ/RimL family protein N-acetyltransferase